jgi:hypothetical protein
VEIINKNRNAQALFFEEQPSAADNHNLEFQEGILLNL